MHQVPQQQKPVYHVAGWSVDASGDRLIKGDETVKLEPKIMEVLLCLIERRGQIVSKDELLQIVWPEVTITDHPINRSIYRLRKIFGDDSRAPRVIETVSKKGYRLIDKAITVPPANGWPGNGNGAMIESPGNQKAFSVLQYLAPLLALTVLIFLGTLIFEAGTAEPGELSAIGPGVPLTASVGLERGVAFSPDNQRIVYIHQGPDNSQWDLYLKEIGGPSTRLTNTAFQERDACFSPDGRAVTFVEVRENGSRIVSLSLQDSSLSELVVEPEKLILGLQWAPDGETLVYAARTAPDNPYALFLFSPKSGKKKQLTTPKATFYADREPIFTPDGKRLIFARMDSQYNDDLYLMSTADWQVSRLTHDNQIIFGLDWSPLTDEIVYCVYDNGSHLMRAVNLAGRVRDLKLTAAAQAGMFPRISPSGKLLSYEQMTLRKNIYRGRINLAEGRLEEVTQVVTSSVADWNGKLSPDGGKIVFVSDRSGSNQLWLSDIDGGEPRTVVDWTVPYNCMSSWAPDGRSLVFAVKPAEVYLTYRFVPESGALTQLAADAAAPMYSRDGRWIYFSSMRSGDWRIWKMPAAGGRAVQVTQTNGFAAMESIDGKTLFYCKRGVRGLWKKTGEATEALVIPDLEIYETQNWLAVADGIYYLRRLKSRFAELVFYRFDDQSYTVLAHPLLAQHRFDDGLTLSTDGREILFSLNDRAESDIKLLQLALE